MKEEPSKFRNLPLRAHEFLGDAALHDVWRIELSGGGPGRNLSALDPFLESGESMRASGPAAFLFKLRFFLGRIFGWDDDAPAQPQAESFVHRLTEEDRARSRREPGAFQGPFRLVYDFENESLGEIINRTVHAFLLQVMVPGKDGDGYVLYWAIYVRETGAFTRFYMKAIQPFREYIVYPAMIKKLKQFWKHRVASSRAQSES